MTVLTHDAAQKTDDNRDDVDSHVFTACDTSTHSGVAEWIQADD